MRMRIRSYVNNFDIYFVSVIVFDFCLHYTMNVKVHCLKSKMNHSTNVVFANVMISHV